MDKLLNDFSPGLFVVQTILNEREEGIQGALDAAEKAKREMANLQADNQKLLQEARLEREAMLKEARDLKSKMIADAETAAKTQANKIITQAQEAIDSEKKAAMAELKSHVAGLSLDIAEKVLRNELSNKDKQLKLVEDMLGEATLN
jgi:F-type H+-transporting ATPase subunit b